MPLPISIRHMIDLSSKMELNEEKSPEANEENSRLKIRRQSQYGSFNLDYLDMEDDKVCRKYTQVSYYC